MKLNVASNSPVKFRDIYWTTRDWITRVKGDFVAQSLQVDSEVKPEDSVSSPAAG